MKKGFIEWKFVDDNRKKTNDVNAPAAKFHFDQNDIQRDIDEYSMRKKIPLRAISVFHVDLNIR